MVHMFFLGEFGKGCSQGGQGRCWNNLDETLQTDVAFSGIIPAAGTSKDVKSSCVVSKETIQSQSIL